MQLNLKLFLVSAYAGLHAVQAGTCYYTTDCVVGHEVTNVPGFEESGVADVDEAGCWGLYGLSYDADPDDTLTTPCIANPTIGLSIPNFGLLEVGTCYLDQGCNEPLLDVSVSNLLCLDLLKAGCFAGTTNPSFQLPGVDEGACYFGNNCEEDTAYSLLNLNIYLTQVECGLLTTADGVGANLVSSWKQGTVDSSNECASLQVDVGSCYVDCEEYIFDGALEAIPVTMNFCLLGLLQLNPSFSNPAATCSGDPHLSTWHGKHKVSWHGECDIVAIDNQDFKNGQGIKVYFRTLRDSFYSFINEIVMKIGTDTIEFNSLGDYKINDVPGSMVNSTSETVAGFEFSHWHSGKVYFHRYVLTLGENGEKIDIKAFENVLYFDVNGGASDAFRESVGFLGNGKTGDMLGRDGVTHFEDPHEYAVEWQVRDTEEKLFSTDRYPQYPDVCLPANKKKTRLGEMAATKQAEMLCAGWEQNKDDCVFDVVATRNPFIAEYKTIEAEAIAAQKEQQAVADVAL